MTLRHLSGHLYHCPSFGWVWPTTRNAKVRKVISPGNFIAIPEDLFVHIHRPRLRRGPVVRQQTKLNVSLDPLVKVTLDVLISLLERLERITISVPDIAQGASSVGFQEYSG